MDRHAPLVAHARASEPLAIALELRDALGPAPGLVLYFASSQLDLPQLARAMAASFPSSTVVGCTTCGEIGPDGCTTGRVSALALAEPARARAHAFARMAELKYEQARSEVAELVAGAGEPARTQSDTLAFVSLTDGLSGSEELLLTAIAEVAPGIPLVGGSAGDDFQFRGTAVALGEQVYPGGGVLVLIEPAMPFAVFHLHHYERSGSAMVVTAADPARRRVSRIDGYPAVPLLAKLMGLDEAGLRANPSATIMANPVVFGFVAGPSLFMRSVMTIVDDDLLLAGSLEEGTIIYRMVPGDLVEATRRGLDAALGRVAAPSGLLLFNCGGRMWEASARACVPALARAMLPIAGAGFTTYGEQYHVVHLNHTLTGVVFGQQ
jgi:hypothetical protein